MGAALFSKGILRRRELPCGPREQSRKRRNTCYDGRRKACHKRTVRLVPYRCRAPVGRTTYPWEALPKIGGFIRELGATLSLEEYDHPQEDVWIHKTAKIYPNNFISGPCIIGRETEVRPGAFTLDRVFGGELHRAEKCHPL